MAWYEEAVFYHIYPLGLLGAPEYNDYSGSATRLQEMDGWISHMKRTGFTALYFGPCFSSGSHGYDTTDYRRADERLGTNEDLKEMIRCCHQEGIRVILDGVFNHTGRDFFAFRDLIENREYSRFRDWYSHVDFGGNNEYSDGFSYDNWGGFNLLPKLNLYNREVRDYHLETVRFWVQEFDIDGLRLDVADALDHEFLHELRAVTVGLKEDFWLMGEVIHGEYQRWVNTDMLHSVTNYALHKALYSGHNDHNYFEIAHTIRRQDQMGLVGKAHLYNFADNHDVERIATRLNDKRNYLPLHVLLYTLPGIPSVYYGSEFGVEGRKESGSDASLRPALSLTELLAEDSAALQIISALGRIHNNESALWYGDYRELDLTTTRYAFMRGDILVTVSNRDTAETFDLMLDGSYTGALTGRTICAENGMLHFTLEGHFGEIWIPGGEKKRYKPLKTESMSIINEVESVDSAADEMPQRAAAGKHLEDMNIEELQAEVLARLAANGPLTDQMKREVKENVYRNSLLNWIRSFR